MVSFSACVEKHITYSIAHILYSLLYKESVLSLGRRDFRAHSCVLLVTSRIPGPTRHSQLVRFLHSPIIFVSLAILQLTDLFSHRSHLTLLCRPLPATTHSLVRIPCATLSEASNVLLPKLYPDNLLKF